jgi:hypothetical protein
MTDTYHIRQSDSFRVDLYSEVVAEMMELKRRSTEMNTPCKAQVVISFLRNHSITSRWLESDRDICKLMTSGTLQISYLESLFDGCRHDQKFLEGFESYIKKQLRENQ